MHPALVDSLPAAALLAAVAVAAAAYAYHRLSRPKVDRSPVVAFEDPWASACDHCGGSGELSRGRSCPTCNGDGRRW